MSVMGDWATSIFSQAELGDPRRTRRLVEIVAAMATAPTSSLPVALGGARKDLDACYDLMRSPYFTADELVAPVREHTLERMRALTQSTFVLAADTTSLSINHPTIKKYMGYLSNYKNLDGMLAHSTVAFDETTKQPLGLLSMQRWIRPLEYFKKKDQRKSRQYKEKESFKWQAGCEDLLDLLDNDLRSRCCFCFDREADIPELLNELLAQNVHFLIRSNYNRKLRSCEKKLHEQLSSKETIAHGTVDIAQRKGRKARTAQIEIKVDRVKLQAPHRKAGLQQVKDNEVTAVLVQEKAGSNIPTKAVLKWILLTDEEIDKSSPGKWLEKQRQRYELRWGCEEYHRCWKSEMGVEKLRVQSIQSLEKLIVIKAAISVKMLEISKMREKEESTCLEVLEESEWRLLWRAVEESEPPAQAPSGAWAYKAIAKLGGWYDSKRTGRAGPAALNRGLEKLELLKLGALLASRPDNTFD